MRESVSGFYGNLAFAISPVVSGTASTILRAVPGGKESKIEEKKDKQIGVKPNSEEEGDTGCY
jgi:hypothetical protein